MPFKLVKPVIDLNVRRLCVRPYHGHPHGCPNHDKKQGCPSKAPILDYVFDLERPIWAVWNAFDFAGHVGRMRDKHPEWSHRQLACCLYWQRGARNDLAVEIRGFLSKMVGCGLMLVTCPEATGVNVTATMKSIGIELEWPPRTVTYQVALCGSPVSRRRAESWQEQGELL